MAIRIEHQPVEAIGQLGVLAGQAQVDKEQRNLRDREQLMKLDAGHKMEQMRFLQQAQEQARAEEMQYQMQLNMQRRDIDMQLDLQNYAREKQKLQQTLNMINQSEDLSEAEKEEFGIQATAAYAGVGTGITPASFNSGINKALQNEILLGSHRTMLADDIQSRLDAGDIDEYQANRESVQKNLGITFEGPQTRVDNKLADLLDTVKTTRDVYNKSFFTDKAGKPFDAITEEPVKKGTDKYEDQAGDLQGMLDFAELAKTDSGYIELVENLGFEGALQEYLKRQKKSSTFEEQEQPGIIGQMRRHPILQGVLGRIPYAGTLVKGANLADRYGKEAFKQVVDPESETNKYLREKTGYGLF
jgi:hypothetical protein